MDDSEKKLGPWVIVKEDEKKVLAQSKKDAKLPVPAAPVNTTLPYPIDYKVPEYGQDRDIQDSLKNLKDSEDKHGTWNGTIKAYNQSNNTQVLNITLAAKAKKSDPICPSSGCPEPKKVNTTLPYPIDYKVPDYGQDRDVQDSLKNLKDTEAKLGTWTLPPLN